MHVLSTCGFEESLLALQERATLVAKQQSSEQRIKHLEERVMYLEDCLDQSPGTTTDEHATIDGGLTSAEQDACNVQYG